MSKTQQERRFDIGRVRPDGRFNIWTKFDVRGYGDEWVIIDVRKGWTAAVERVRELNKQFPDGYHDDKGWRGQGAL